MSKTLLIKMLYFVDRESLKRWGEPLTGDQPFSLPHGPVLSTVYDLTKGASLSHRSYWEQFISDPDPETSEVSLRRKPEADYLSKSELDVIDGVFAKFGKFSWSEMRDYCHTHLPEWKDPGASSREIPIEDILKHVGKTPEEIASIRQQADEGLFLELVLATD